MKEFFAQLSDGSYIKQIATRMEKEDNMIYVYYEKDLIAAVDVSTVLFANLHEFKN